MAPASELGRRYVSALSGQSLLRLRTPVPDSEDSRSLLGGRRTRPLDENEVVSVANTFYGLDRGVEATYDDSRPTGFRVDDSEGSPVGKITYGPDIYPGPGVADPNSALSMKAAVAHELSHYHRWRDTTELPIGRYRDLDEALTSLDALLRYRMELSAFEVEQLARDAILRLQRLRAVLFAADDAGESGAS